LCGEGVDWEMVQSDNCNAGVGDTLEVGGVGSFGGHYCDAIGRRHFSGGGSSKSPRLVRG
jgi:hypothetical protein